jgi:mRNA interferase MazF
MKQGEIWLINLDPTIGAEIKKTRPAIIVNNDALGKLPLKIIVPITDWKERYEIAPWMIKIVPNQLNGLTKLSSADCFQIRSVSQERFIKRLGKISTIILDELRNGLSKVLTIEID